ncbi:unnamed protein product [Orchesella dallaii]|uniref:Uncharacterized protein n=1 Tax=Orchesella dallaii TaxID=48710 RepID=A0ABP1PME7_9HEXA
MLYICPWCSLEKVVKAVAIYEIKKEAICWVWLGLTMTIITISVVSEIYKFLGVEIGPIGGNRKDASAALLIYTLAQYLEIWVVLRFVMQLRHQRKAHQLGLSVGVANGAGVGKIRQEPLVKAADYGHYEQPHSLPVYQPTSTISTV